MRGLDGFMSGVVSRLDTIHGLLVSLRGEVGVKLQHGVVRGDGLAPIHLNLVVVLASGGRRHREEAKEHSGIPERWGARGACGRQRVPGGP